jgi:beta-lactamase superfamily II metal-dependent hydrolase
MRQIAAAVFFLSFVSLAKAETMIHVLDVGQADAIHVEAGANNYLFNTGPAEATQHLLEHFSERGIASLTAIFLSSAKKENAGALKKIIQQMGPTPVYWNDELPPDEESVENFETAQAATEFHVMKHGDMLPLGDGVTLQVLNATIASNDFDDKALVFGLSTEKAKILIPNDIGFSRQENLPEANPLWFKKVQLLIWPRHGDTLARPLKNALKSVANCALSVGPNDDGLPSTTFRKEAAGFCQEVARTDQLGDLHYGLVPDVRLLRKTNMSLYK